jgi:hypothetical protein
VVVHFQVGILAMDAVQFLLVVVHHLPFVVQLALEYATQFIATVEYQFVVQ